MPFAETLEMPSTCSSAGTILFVTIADMPAMLSEFDVSESVTTTAWAGSKVRTEGAGRSTGRALFAV